MEMAGIKACKKEHKNTLLLSLQGRKSEVLSAPPKAVKLNDTKKLKTGPFGRSVILFSFVSVNAMSLQYQIIPVTPFAQNCTLLWCDETMQAALVDPGGDLPRLWAAVQKNGVTLAKILLTHGHIDHAGAAAELAEQLALPIEGPQQEDKFWLDGLEQQAQNYGFSGVRSCTPDLWLVQGDTVCFGQEELAVLHCPGHTPGHVVFFSAPKRLALVGDVLFKGSVGRTDFPKGDFTTLLASIRERLWPLGDDVAFISGHGTMSTFGFERRTNPFCGDGVA